MSRIAWTALRKKFRLCASRNLFTRFVRPDLYRQLADEPAFSGGAARLIAELFQSPFLSKREIYRLAKRALDAQLSAVVFEDLQTIAEQDPACRDLSQAFLFAKGWQAIAASRIAQFHYREGRCDQAFALAGSVNFKTCIDIHPGARFGRRLTLDHGGATVIGETCIIGDDVRLFQNVTLGGVKSVREQRHPIIGDHVLIGANALILGNVTIGKRAKIGAGALVVRDVPQGAVMIGKTAREYIPRDPDFTI